MTYICKSNLSRIVGILILYTQCMQICAKIEAEIDFDVEGNGFHRTLIYHVYLKNLINDNCQVAIYLELPSALYVNTDEIAELRRRKMSTVCSIGDADIELFTEKASSQNVTTCASVNSSLSNLIIPVHQRYQYADKIGDYINVIVPKPRLLLGCQDRIKGHRVSKINLCEPCVDLMAKWREISYHMLNNSDYIWSIPIGDTSLSILVTYITLLATVIGAMFIGHAIRVNALQNHSKED